MKALVVGTIFSGLGGGSDVNYEVLKTLPQLGIDVTLYVPTFYVHRAVLAYLKGSSKKHLENPVDRLRELEQAGVKVLTCISTETSRLMEKYSEIAIKYRDLISPLFLWKAARRDKKIISKYEGHGKFDFVLAMNEIFPVFNCALTASSMLRISKCVVMLHTEPFIASNHNYSNLNGYHLSGKVKNLIIKRKWTMAFRKGIIAGITSPSEAPILISGLKDKLTRMNIPVYYPDPPWCISDNFYKSRNLKSRGGAIFISRLVEDKGIFEIPDIVSSLSDKKITILGDFTELKDKDRFFDLSSEKGIEVNYLGFKSHDELIPLLAKHRVLLYPSHADAFPLTLTQAIIVGTSVVAYDIPAVMVNYAGLKSVSIIKEGDVKSMARKADEIMQMSERDYEKMHNDEVELTFIEKFRDCKSIWLNYGKWIYNLIEP